MELIQINQHPSNNDPSARLVREDRGGKWSVYSVKGGFVGIANHMAIDGLFLTEHAALEAVTAPAT